MIIGLTGGIGSGKSTVLNFFKELGFKTYIADFEAKQLMVSDAILIEQITELFGSEAYENGTLNRAFIASKVFDNKALLQQLNGLVHPRVRNHFESFVAEAGPDVIIIYEAAILFESGSHKNCDYIITVVSDIKERIQRVIARDNTKEAAIKKRIENQSSDIEKIKKSHFVIQNKQLHNTKEQVVTISEILSKIVKI